MLKRYRAVPTLLVPCNGVSCVRGRVSHVRGRGCPTGGGEADRGGREHRAEWWLDSTSFVLKLVLTAHALPEGLSGSPALYPRFTRHSRPSSFHRSALHRSPLPLNHRLFLPFFF